MKVSVAVMSDPVAREEALGRLFNALAQLGRQTLVF